MSNLASQLSGNKDILEGVMEEAVDEVVSVKKTRKPRQVALKKPRRVNPLAVNLEHSAKSGREEKLTKKFEKGSIASDKAAIKKEKELIGKTKGTLKTEIAALKLQKGAIADTKDTLRREIDDLKSEVADLKMLTQHYSMMHTKKGPERASGLKRYNEALAAEKADLALQYPNASKGDIVKMARENIGRL